MSIVLAVEDLRVAYSGADVLRGLNFEVSAGQIVTLLGANGAGKTTAMHAVAGVLRPKSGRVRAFGQDVTSMSQTRLVRSGLVLVPEGRHVFASMTVLENIELGAFVRADKAEVAADRDFVLELFPRLKERLGQRAGTMSGGEQQMLAIGRALMARPKLLLLDEPTLGLAPMIVELISSAISRLRASGMSILIVEQNASVALGLADYGYLIAEGAIAASGPTDILRKDEKVAASYLGEAH